MELLLLPSLKQNGCGGTIAGRVPSLTLWLATKEKRVQWTWDRQMGPGAKAGRGAGSQKPSGSESVWRKYRLNNPFTGGAP